MTEKNRLYFRERAEMQLQAGQTADHPNAARAHYVLAGLYFDRAFNPNADTLPHTAARRI